MWILDLFCGAGGAAMGYHQAFPDAEIIGVDIHPQPRYPFHLIRGDAVTVGAAFLNQYEFDFVHAFPPCQAHTAMSNRWRGQGGKADSHVDLIPAIRDVLVASGVPYVIENVVGARKSMRTTLLLSGGMFGLGVDRPRLFECSFIVPQPDRVPVVDPIGVYGEKHDGRRLSTRKDGTIQRAASSLEQARAAMGIDWMEWRELAESIPPAYTRYIGEQLAAQLERV